MCLYHHQIYKAIMFARGSVKRVISIGVSYGVKRECFVWCSCFAQKENDPSSLLRMTFLTPSHNYITSAHLRNYGVTIPFIEASTVYSLRHFLWAQRLDMLVSCGVLRNWVCSRYLSSASIELRTDSDLVRFSIGKRLDKSRSLERQQKNTKRIKISRKNKLNELRFYRLKAKKKMNSPNPEVRIRYKLEKAKRKEAWLIEKLRKFEVPKMQAEAFDPEMLTEEEKHYLQRTGEKKKNFILVGRRGVFGGVVLNMHLHWKKHETVKVICKPCKPGQIQEYAYELARLSKGIVIDIKSNNSIIFYRGKNYVQPAIMSPPDTLSKPKALEKYKYEQSLEHTSQFIEKLEKELQAYLEHVARYKKGKECKIDMADAGA